METRMNKRVSAQTKTLNLYIKERGEFGAFLINQDGCGLAVYEDFLPDFIPLQPCSHYFMLAIDMNTGKITNWKKPTPEQIENCLTYSKQPIRHQTSESSKLKQKLCALEDQICLKQQKIAVTQEEIAATQEEVEQLYKELKQCQGEAA